MNPAAPQRPVVVVFMGVAGSGKTTVGKLFAAAAGARFYEGDDFHPPENIARMSRGIPLTDADREEWLRKLGKIITEALAGNALSVVACSALKEKYREILSAGDARVRFVHLTGPAAVIEERLKNRPGHFMPPSLLASQLAILEPPSEALVYGCEQSPETIVTRLLHDLGVAPA